MSTQWLNKPLGQVATLQRGFDLPHRARVAGIVPVVTSSGIEDFHREAKVKGPGVVTGRYGTIGEVFYVEKAYWPHNTSLYVRDFHGNDPKFVYYLLQTIDFKTHSGKSGVPGINRNDIHEETVRIPSCIREQVIVAKALSDADAWMELLEQMIAKKRSVKKGALQELLSGKTRLPGFSRPWASTTLDELTVLLTNGFVGIATTAYVEGDRGVLYVQGYNIEPNGFNFHGIKRVSQEFHSRNQKSCLQTGDLLTIQTGGIGVTTVVPDSLEGANCHALIISRLKKSVADPRFYAQLFNSEQGTVAFKEIETGTTMKHLNCSDMKKLVLPYPSVDEQRAIAATLADLDFEIAEQERKLSKARQIKQAMMQELLTGRTRLVEPTATTVTMQEDTHA